MTGRRRKAPLRMGLAGVGRMGRRYLDRLAERSDVELAAMADPSLVLPDRHADAWHVYDDARHMIEVESLDALIVAVPAALHHPLAMAALERGVPLLIEKPLTTTVESSVELVRRSAELGSYVQVGHIERFNPAVRGVSSVLDDAVGRIYGIRSVRAGPPGPRDVDIALDLATHDVDLICHLLGDRPLRVQAEVARHRQGAQEDHLVGLMAFDGQRLAQLDVNWLTSSAERRLEVLGDRGSVYADLVRKSVVCLPAEPPASPGSHRQNGAPLSVAPDDALDRQLDAFVAGVRGEAASPVSAEDGLWAVYLATLLMEAGRERRPMPVTFPLLPAT